jgi:predicted site-specific integrase-resolvase
LSDLFLTQKTLAHRWGISPRTLERWRVLGVGPTFIKLNWRVLYRLEDVEAFEAAKRRASTSGAAGQN